MNKKTKYGVDLASTLGMKPSPHTFWFIVASSAEAKIFEYKTSLKKIFNLEHPKGKWKESELSTDRPGRSFDSSTKSKEGKAPRHAMSNEESPKEHELNKFAETLSEYIEKGRAENRFSELILIAEPRLMGKIKSHLSKPTLSLLSKEEEKDFAWLTEKEVEDRIIVDFLHQPPKYPAETCFPKGKVRDFNNIETLS